MDKAKKATTQLTGTLGEFSQTINRVADAVYDFFEQQGKKVGMHPILYMIMIVILAFTLIYVLWLSRLFNVHVEHYENADDEEEDDEDIESEVEDEEVDDEEEYHRKEKDRRPVKLVRPRQDAGPEPKRHNVLTKRATVQDDTPSKINGTKGNMKAPTKQSFVGRIVEKFLAYLP